MSVQHVMEVDGLKKYFAQNDSFIDRVLGRSSNSVRAVDDVTFDLSQNEVVGVIGESGCGKTTLLRTLIGVYDPTEGDIRYGGKPLHEFDKEDMKKYRKNVQIIFQNPFDSLDPKMTVRKTLKEPLEIHGIENKEEQIKKTLEDVELEPVERYLDRYPEQLSGGQKQRVAIGRALVLEPDIILADEPVSMLDVSTQASILKLLSELVDEYNSSMVYISHDLSTVSYVCDEINVMYLGRFVERAPTKKLLSDPQHPYSQALINAVPVPNPDANRSRTQLEGSTPDPSEMPDGCRFKDRCPERMDVCDKTPRFLNTSKNRSVSCHLYDEEASEDTSIKTEEA